MAASLSFQFDIPAPPLAEWPLAGVASVETTEWEELFSALRSAQDDAAAKRANLAPDFKKTFAPDLEQLPEHAFFPHLRTALDGASAPAADLSPVLTPAKKSAQAVRREVEAALAARHPSALMVRPAARPEVLSTGIAGLDAATRFGGIPRGALSELCGPASSGRTSILHGLLARATSSTFGRGEACALIDVNDNFDPASAQRAGVELVRLLWIRCQAVANKSVANHASSKHSDSRRNSFRKNSREVQISARTSLARLEQAWKAAELLLQAGGFSLIVVDMGDVDPAIAGRIPLTSWFRFRRTVESMPTALLVVEQQAHARTCASLVVELKPRPPRWRSAAATRVSHSALLAGYETAISISRCALATEPRAASSPPLKIAAGG